MDREVVKELIQDELTVENLCKSLGSLLQDSQQQAQLKADYALLLEKLSAEGAPSDKAASTLLAFMGVKTS